MKSSLALLCTLLLPVVANAQDPVDLRLSDGFAEIDETMVRDPDLNVQACFAELTERITFDVTYTGTAIFLDDAMLRVWLESSSETDCVGQIPANGDEDYIGDVLLGADDPFLTGSALIRIPDDLEDDTGAVPVLDSQSLLEMRGACPEGTDETVTLCIGLDEDKDGTIDEGLAYESHGWVRFAIDTERPPKPNITRVRPLDGRLEVKLSVSGDATDDIDYYKINMRPEPADPAERGVACDQWGDPAGLRTATGEVALGVTSATVEINGTNGVTYEICVFAVDDVGNFSEPSDLATGTPQQECDFIECYPDDLLDSGCRATGTTPVAGLSVLLLALWRARERRR